MAYQFIVGVGGAIASLLGLFFLYYKSLLRGHKKTRTASMEFPKENCVKETGNREVVGTTDIIIVGAGVAGAALAYALGKDGRRVRVIERDLNAPDTIAGEGLMPGGYLKLIELGLEDCVDEIDAQRILGYVLYKDGKDAKVSFPLEKFQSHVAGRNFHHGRFVQRLREKVASLHNVSLGQGTVTSLLEENGTVKGVHYKNKSGQVLTAYAPLTIVCDGGFSNLRHSLCYPKVDVPSYFVGLILNNCKLPHANFGALILADPSPILFYPISSTEIRCLVDVPSQNVPSVSDGEMAHYLKTLVAPKVPPELQTAFIFAIEKRNNIRTMPNRIMAAASCPTPGALLMGDAFNMRHPITGGGMTVALSDVVVLRDLLRPLHNLYDAYAVCKYLESFYTLRKPMASTINTLANLLHKVFSASSDPAMEDIQQACFGYLRIGGVFTDGLSALLSGLYPRPLSLAFHCFAIAIYGVGRLLLPFPSPKRMWTGAKLIWVASGILFPLIKSEGVRQMFFPLTVPAYYRTPPL
ncbi:squalene monooxygenase-like [Durio zibethinus]|uniref:Squalene monooxygenase n=1 Tax=Durio zibethinus TaxID=66656 RepID=A0A6P5XBG4_DURZI|nr:squalene monooxygenase-like [Durio zibethinus]